MRTQTNLDLVPDRMGLVLEVVELVSGGLVLVCQVVGLSVNALDTWENERDSQEQQEMDTPEQGEQQEMDTHDQGRQQEMVSQGH